MRDYAELVDGLRECAKHTCCSCPPATKIAADAIEELLAAVPRWISVEERLPEEEEAVLAFCTNTGTVKVAWIIEGVWWTWDFYGFCISHWMPLPAPPEEGDE